MLNMNPQDLQNKIEELTKKFDDLKTKFDQSENDQRELSLKFKDHQHSGTDGSGIIDKELRLKSGTPIKLGNGGILAYTNADLNTISPGSVSEQTVLSLVAGKDMDGSIGTTTGNMQFNFQHFPQGTQSFFTAVRPPVYTNIPGSTVSTTLGGNTITINGYNFTTNSLTGALIVISNSAGTLIETQTIASNTDTVITITGTWLASTSSATFLIYVPCFMGSAQTIFQRFYTAEGTGGGIRFGVGVTNGGQNGLAYMDSTGDLYWRDKAGASTKLNTGITSALSTVKISTGTRAGDTASGTQNIAHGLGAIPNFVRVTAIKGTSGTNIVARSEIIYDGTSTGGNFFIILAATSASNGTSNLLITDDIAQTNRQYATITFDATNTILTWTKEGTPTSDNINIMIEAIT